MKLADAQKEEGGVVVSVRLPADLRVAAAACGISAEFKDLILEHSEHPDSCPWRAGLPLISGLGLTLAETLASAIKNAQWDVDELDQFLASVKHNAFAYLKLQNDG